LKVGFLSIRRNHRQLDVTDRAMQVLPVRVQVTISHSLVRVRVKYALHVNVSQVYITINQTWINV